ncbi:hypothetical protein E4U56_000637 [Claviceps arundinis]|uniref:Integral membrane protein n=1 Tax=Claviceps arundinis TaxID=1623583 RepID=A0A9P7SQN1_9HYPO|nr:hypothetical protein E4U56_000637 [Claviceps arundinis]
MDSSAPSHRRPRSESQLSAADRSFAARRASLQSHGHGQETPAESDDPAGEDLGSPSSGPSRPSWLSRMSFRRSPTPAGSEARPAESITVASDERPQRPSIRIRRSSVGLTGGQQQQSHQQDTITPAEPEHDNTQDYFAGGRPRSFSQPGAAPPAATDATGRVRHLRRAQPQISLPRLTEEGTRPSMAELGLAGRRNSPPHSGAGAPSSARAIHGRSSSAGDVRFDDVEAQSHARSVAPKRSIVGRIFRPGSRASFVTAQSHLSNGDESRHSKHSKQSKTSRHTDEYNEELVDWLDIIDPEVQTLSTLTNVQNSLFVPDLGSWVNRRPAYVLSQPDGPAPAPRPVPFEAAQPPDEPTIPEQPDDQQDGLSPGPRAETPSGPRMRRTTTITSQLSESHYAALPHGETLEGWSADEKRELDDHVRHMLHSRRSKFKRQMKGFGQYVRRPLGFFVTLYATLITLFGLAWVLFLIGWIYVGEQQVYAIHIIDSVLVALFAIMGDGLAPFRAVDTYHMVFIARYARIIAKAKKRAAKEAEARGVKEVKEGVLQSDSDGTQGEQHAVDQGEVSDNGGGSYGHSNMSVPQITVHEPAPDAANTTNSMAIANNADASELEPENDPSDLEDTKSLSSSILSLQEDYLTPPQRASLAHHQKKLAKSHSFYKPHETFTHHAFPLGHLMAIIILLDFHSCLQISLGATTWGIDYHHRPFAITTVILCVSITCNLTAGLVIMFGDRKTRKKDVVDLLDRQALTGDAMKKVERKRHRGREGQEGDEVREGES